jgi:short subunit fatty acids transporter
MSSRSFLNKNKKIIILFGIIIIAFVIYRYFWEKRNILVDINLDYMDDYESDIRKLLTDNTISNIINNSNQKCNC